MAQFGIRSLLIAFAVVSLWLSTFVVSIGASDIRKGILLAVLSAAGYYAVCFNGRRRAFWAGFFIVMLIHGPNLSAALDSQASRLKFGYVASFDIDAMTNRLIPYVAASGTAHYERVYRAISATLNATWLLTLSTLIGLIGLFIYDQSRSQK